MTEEVLPVDYTYVVARLRAIEAELPDKAWFQRLARSASGQLIGSMREHYRGFERVDAVDEFELGLENEQASYLDLISSLVGDEAVVSFLRSGYDFDNALHLVKARRMGGKAHFNDSGLVEKELFEKAFEDGDFDRFPVKVREYLAMVDGKAEKDEPPALQYFGENLKYRYLLDTAPDREAAHYLRTRIDLANIVILIRLERSQLRSDRPMEAFLEGGRIGREHFISLMREPEDELYSFLQFSDYRRLLTSGLAKEMPLWRVEALTRAFLLESLSESRLRFFDISPVLFHIELRGRDEHLLRTILTGKSNGMPEEFIMERVDQILPS
jgi:vacuolar-type H+-ATPase subunit C/Vma6